VTLVSASCRSVSLRVAKEAGVVIEDQTTREALFSGIASIVIFVPLFIAFLKGLDILWGNRCCSATADVPISSSFPSSTNTVFLSFPGGGTPSMRFARSAQPCLPVRPEPLLPVSLSCVILRCCDENSSSPLHSFDDCHPASDNRAFVFSTRRAPWRRRVG
jgi:hypothetical protein